MGPQLDSCGRRLVVRLVERHARASMGPQLDSCGRWPPWVWVGAAWQASMGPQLDSCGRLSVTDVRAVKFDGLQWGRNLTVAEGGSYLCVPYRLPASMGPQLDSCGRLEAELRLADLERASMGPQLDSCGRQCGRG